jgi:hypothetical protein
MQFTKSSVSSSSRITAAVFRNNLFLSQLPVSTIFIFGEFVNLQLSCAYYISFLFRTAFCPNSCTAIFPMRRIVVLTPISGALLVVPNLLEFPERKKLSDNVPDRLRL